MYYTIISSTISGLRMSRLYFSFFAFSVSLFFTSAALSNNVENSDSAHYVMPDKQQCVILLHGLSRSKHSMGKMEQALVDAGYSTANINYPSRTMKIQDLAPLAMNKGIQACASKGASTIHIVTHSMGGILARYYLAKNELTQLGHLVQLAPPNKGSLLTDQLRKEQWYKWLTGPAGQQLGTGKDGIPGLLGAVDYSTGVIAGDEHSPVDNWLSELIPGTDDGKVSVDHAKVDGMTDFIVLPYTHISIMKEDEVIQQTLFFLYKGRFKHPEPI